MIRVVTASRAPSRRVHLWRAALALALGVTALLAGCASAESSSASLMTESLEAKNKTEGPVAAAQGLSGTSGDDDIGALLSAASVVDDIRKTDERFNAAVAATGDRSHAVNELDDIIAIRPKDTRYRSARANLAIELGDPATAKTHWNEMDRLTREAGQDTSMYWMGVATQAQILQLQNTILSDPARGDPLSGDTRAAYDAALEREIQAYEALADIATANLSLTLAAQYMKQADEARVRLNQQAY